MKELSAQLKESHVLTLWERKAAGRQAGRQARVRLGMAVKTTRTNSDSGYRPGGATESS